MSVSEVKEIPSKVSSTKRILFSSSVLQEPFVALNQMLDVFLSAHFGASALQISLLTTLRPTLAVLAFYWGSILYLRPHFLRLSLVTATILSTFLFLFAPFADNIWYFILAEAAFALFWKAQIPAQIEILKVNVEKGEREKLFSLNQSVSYASGMIIGPLLGLFLKSNGGPWKELFAVTAFLYGASAYLKSKYYVPAFSQEKRSQVSFQDVVITPWKESLRLLKTNKAFYQFQLGFFIGGSALMFAKPSIPGFLTSMQLSFLEIFSLFTLLDGFGFILASTFWPKRLEAYGLHTTSSWVLLCFCLQPLFLIASWLNPIFVFFAYFFYGVAQAGSRLVWNMSGPLLCGSDPSSQYSSVNILAIGLRGCLVPVLGAIFSTFFGPTASLTASLTCMLVGSLYFYKVSKSICRGVVS